MSEVTNSALHQQVYRVHNGDSLVSQVAKVILVAMPRALAVAGFSDRGDLLMVRYSDYKPHLPPWILDFFEHQFINEPLLQATNKVNAAFVATDKNILIPEVLYNEGAAEQWLRRTHFVEANEVISMSHMREDRSHYVYAWPAAVKSLLNRYFPQGPPRPLASYQFYKSYKAEHSLQCAITSDKVFATLYKDRQLCWHQVFPYNTAEDIAYHIGLLCTEHDINPQRLDVHATVIQQELAPLIRALSEYYPTLKDGTGNIIANEPEWVSTIYLLQQLYACA